jgi:hypothetical protein
LTNASCGVSFRSLLERSPLGRLSSSRGRLAYSSNR